MILGLTGKTRVSWFPVSIARPIGVLSCFRMLGLFFSAVTEKLKVKSYQTILNVKDSQKVFADVNFKVLKNGILSFYGNIRIFQYICIFEYIRICFTQYKYIHIRIRMKISWTNIFVFVFGPEKNIRSSLLIGGCKPGAARHRLGPHKLEFLLLIGQSTGAGTRCSYPGTNQRPSWVRTAGNS